MADKIKLIGLKGIPLIKPGDNIPEIILTSLKKHNIELENGDILVIAQTIISKYSNRLVDLNNIKPSKMATIKPVGEDNISVNGFILVKTKGVMRI